MLQWSIMRNVFMSSACYLRAGSCRSYLYAGEGGTGIMNFLSDSQAVVVIQTITSVTAISSAFIRRPSIVIRRSPAPDAEMLRRDKA